MADGTSIDGLSFRARHKAETRRRILAAARDAFIAHGYGGVDIRTLARTAGFSTGAVFASWPGKAALYVEATGRPAPVGALREAAPDLLTALEAMVEAYREGCADEHEPSMVQGALAAIARAKGHAP